MNGTGLCDICGNAAHLYTCMLCGKRVCGECITVRGVCRICLKGRKLDDVKDLMKRSKS